MFGLVLIVSFFFSWVIVALQCCTTKWISCLFIYIYPLPLDPPSHLLHLTPLNHPRTPSSAPCIIQQEQQVSISYMFYTWWCTYISPHLPIHPCPSPPLHAHASILHIFVSADRFICTIFSRFHIYVLIYNICCLFWLNFPLTLGPSCLYKWPNFVLL